jgi:hemoglobin
MSETLYERVGGEIGVQRLVTLFYDEMESSSDAANVRALHPADLTSAREKLFQYFTGWFGGPALYTDRYGHPRLRARHMHVPIGVPERDAWLVCLLNALKTMDLEPDLLAELLEKVVPMADHMRNQDPTAESTD